MDIFRPFTCGTIVLCMAFVVIAAEDADLAPIDIKLPAPFFAGTPLRYENEHLEEVVLTPRAPFLAPKGATIISANKPVTSSAHSTVPTAPMTSVASRPARMGCWGQPR